MYYVNSILTYLVCYLICINAILYRLYASFYEAVNLIKQELLKLEDR